MSSATPLPIIDARAATRARQPGHILLGVVVTVTQAATGRRQAVRVVAADARGARALAMLHCTLLDGLPRDLNPGSLALRHLEFEVCPDEVDPVTLPCPRLSMQPTSVSIRTSVLDGEGDPADGDYAAYSVVIATHPLYWTTTAGAEVTVLEARRRAEVLADMVRNVFPGLRCVLVPGPVEKLDLSSGPDTAVREFLEAWLERRMAEMFGTAAEPVTAATMMEDTEAGR